MAGADIGSGADGPEPKTHTAPRECDTSVTLAMRVVMGVVSVVVSVVVSGVESVTDAMDDTSALWSGTERFRRSASAVVAVVGCLAVTAIVSGAFRARKIQSVAVTDTMLNTRKAILLFIDPEVANHRLPIFGANRRVHRDVRQKT